MWISNKNISLFILLILAFSASTAQNVKKIEYFFDADPGFGNGIQVSIDQNNDTLKSFLVPLQSLPYGLHNLYIRVWVDPYQATENNAPVTRGGWSLSHMRTFYKDTLILPANNFASVTGYEYFFDIDPGFGKGTTMPIQFSNNPDSLSFAADVSRLPAGVHTFYLRSKNSYNYWGLTSARFFYKAVMNLPDTSLVDIVKGEYYIDVEPGYGKGIPVTINPGTNITDLTFLANLTGISPGNHKIYFRAQDAKGRWSLNSVDSFKASPPTQVSITIGNIAANLCSGGSVNIPFAANTLFATDNVFTAQLSNSSGSFTTPVEIGTFKGNISDTIRAKIPDNIPTGTNYRIRVIASSPKDTSLPNTSAIAIGGAPNQAVSIIGKADVCFGVQTYTASPAAQPDAKYRWELGSGGPLDTTGGNATITWNMIGAHTLKLSYYNACGTGQTKTLQITAFAATPSLTPTITLNANQLRASTATRAQGVLGYQWYKDGAILPAATDSFFSATENGSYTVHYTNPCGTGPASQEVIIGENRQAQTISFQAIPDKVFGDTAFALAATASSGLPVTFKVVSGSATLNGNILTITGAGTITIQADQAGNNTYTTATSTRSFNVAKANQAIRFDATADTAKGSSYVLAANASSGLPVGFTITKGYAVITGNTLSFTGAGEVVVRATQAGNANYNASFVEKLFCVSPGQPGPVSGYAEVCKSSQTYSITDIPGANFIWSVSEGGRLLSNTGTSVTIEWIELGSHTLVVRASTPCNAVPGPARILAVNVTNTIIPQEVAGLHPNTDTLIQSFPFAISWKPSANAQFYDLYIWLDGAKDPASPVASNITQIGVAVYQSMIPDFSPGKRYRWKIVAKNACKEVSSTTQTFRLSDLPNLVVQDIEVPPSAFSGQKVSIVAEIKNIGKADTRTGSWVEAVYFSEDSVLDERTDLYLTGKSNITALSINQSYRTSISFNIPENIQGRYYIIVKIQDRGEIAETSLDDNTGVKELRVNLTPPPDLQITSLTSRLEAFSGQRIPVEWMVTNKGTGDTKVEQWKDILYLSPNKELDINSAIKLGEVSHSRGILKKDSSYKVQFTAFLPIKIFGMHYLYIVTDAGNQVLEFSFENNNTRRSDSLNIYLTPPPDFIVSQLNVPDMATSRETVTVDWFVKNQGASRPHETERTWTDAVYVSRDSIFNPQAAVFLGLTSPPMIRNNIPVMNPGDFYNNSAQVHMPDRTEGTWYIHVITDYYDNVFEYQKENNNTLASKIKIVNPDFIITNTHSPDSASSGTSIPVQWTIKNIGHGKAINSYRQDAIWLSPTLQFDARTAIRLDELSYNNALDTAGSIINETQVKLPDTLSGRFYIFIEADYHNGVYEENENNNRSIASPIDIRLSPFPDLKLNQAGMAKNSLVASDRIAIHYQVTNAGNGPVIGKSWNDRVFLSKEPVWNQSKVTFIKQFPRSQALMPGDSYEVTDSLEISMKLLRDLGIDSMKCYFYVLADADNSIFEFRAENNNLLRTQPVYMRRGVYADLVVTDVTGSDSAYSGKQASVEWSVRNVGAKTGYYTNYWYDGLYLSKDTLLDRNDVAVASKLIYGPVEQGGGYKEKMTFRIPNGTSGDYYLLLVADQNDDNADNDRLNNVKVVSITVRNEQGQPIKVAPAPIHVTLTPSSDLVVNAFQVPPIGYAGQPVKIKWQVANKGVAATTEGGWTERAYLSLDDKVDGFDKVISSYSRKGNLNAGTAYEDSIEAILPLDALGNYYVLFTTDNNNIVYEHNAENNNMATSLLFVIRQPPADLVITDVAAPMLAMIGDTVTAAWTTRNIGTNPATGRLKEGIYVSRDSLWDKDDILLSTIQGNIDLPVLGETSRSATFRLKGLASGKHFILVRTDLENNIFEQNEDNNVSASGEMQISLLNLPLNTLTANKLRNNDELYYKIDIADSLAGETLLVSLKADSALGTANELYLKYGSIPTRSSYDFAFSKAFMASQDIVVPDLKMGTYYLLAYGSAKQQPQSISLLARKINFEIQAVATNRGGNTGTVTVKITGARFEKDMQVSLYDAALGTVKAQSIDFKSSTTLFATFNLAGIATGAYDLRLVKQSNQSAVLLDGFTVVPGSGGGVIGSGTGGGFYCSIQNTGVEELLGVTVDHPDRARIGFLFPMVIKYGNSGNVDVPAPTRTLVCLNGTPISFTTDDILKALKSMDKNKRWDELRIKFSDPDGINGILRPGATGSIIIYGAAFDPGEILTFRLLE